MGRESRLRACYRLWVRIALNSSYHMNFIIQVECQTAMLFLVRYFLWDALDAIINFIDAGLVAHGIACFVIFFLTYVRVSCIPSAFQTSHSFSPPETIHGILRYTCTSLGSKYLFLE